MDALLLYLLMGALLMFGLITECRGNRGYREPVLVVTFGSIWLIVASYAMSPLAIFVSGKGGVQDRLGILMILTFGSTAVLGWVFDKMWPRVWLPLALAWKRIAAETS